MELIERVKKFFVGDTVSTMDTGENEKPYYPIEHDNLPYTPLNKARVHPRAMDEYWLRDRSNRLRVSVNDLNDRVERLEEQGVIKNLFVVTSEEFTIMGTPYADAAYNFKNELEALSTAIGRPVLPICICGFDTVNIENNNNKLGMYIPYNWFMQGQIAHVYYTNNYAPGSSVACNCVIQILVKET